MESIETITVKTESEVLRMLINPEHPENYIAGNRLHITEISDDWNIVGGRASISGYLESPETSHHINIYIKFPGFIARSINRVRGKEPKVYLHMSID